MKKTHSKYIIIGAGLSGLTTAYQLVQQGEKEILILEGRDRIGGRVLTKNHIDLGPAWFQSTHLNLEQLLSNLELGKFHQYSKGKSVLVYNTMAPAHYFESDQSQPSAYRIVGGSYELIKALTEYVSEHIVLNTKVSKLSSSEDRVTVYTDKIAYTAEKVIVTLPPKLATHLDFEPALPKALTSVMQSTHTWMSNAIKVGISYKRAFWRDNAFSGMVLGQVGPVVELYDHTNADETEFSLMGFVNEGLRDVSAEERKNRILKYLEQYLGSEIKTYLSYNEKDWSVDPFTSSSDLKSVYMSPKYGNKVFESFYMYDKVLFSGTETSPHFGGYLEGAVISGILAAKRVMDYELNDKT